MIRRNLDIPEETGRNVRKLPSRMQGGENNLSRFVDQAVNQAMLTSPAEALWDRNKDLSPESAQKLADAAVDEVRAHRP